MSVCLLDTTVSPTKTAAEPMEMRVRYSQPYSTGGSSDTAFRCQCCSNLLLLTNRWLDWSSVVVVIANEDGEKDDEDFDEDADANGGPLSRGAGHALGRVLLLVRGRRLRRMTYKHAGLLMLVPLIT